MKPNAFVIIAFKEPYNELYEKVIQPSLKKLGFESVRADQLSGSTGFFQDIQAHIKQADLVVAEVTAVNRNVYLEFGMALAQGKEVVVLTQSVARLPSDTRHIRHLHYNPNDRKALKKKLVEWIKDTHAYTQLEQQRPANGLPPGESSGETFVSISLVDPDARLLELQILDDVRNGAMLLCSHSYNTDKGTIHWLRLSSDPLYKVFHESIAFLSQNGRSLLEAAGNSFLQGNPDFISIGPGNGQKDRVLLLALLDVIKSPTTEVFYYPVDVSDRMLKTAIRCVKGDPRIKDRIKVEAIRADFNKLPEFRDVFDHRSGPNLLAFLGNTLGNVQNEKNLLNSLKAAMKPGDILLLEVRRRTATPELGGQDEDQIGLSFSPLARLGVSFDQFKVDRVEIYGFSQIANTQTIATNYQDAVIGGKKYDSVVLSCVNYYDPKSLENELCGKSSLNFKLLKYHETLLLAYFVLQK